MAESVYNDSSLLERTDGVTENPVVDENPVEESPDVVEGTVEETPGAVVPDEDADPIEGAVEEIPEEVPEEVVSDGSDDPVEDEPSVTPSEVEDEGDVTPADEPADEPAEIAASNVNAMIPKAGMYVEAYEEHDESNVHVFRSDTHIETGTIYYFVDVDDPDFGAEFDSADDIEVGSRLDGYDTRTYIVQRIWYVTEFLKNICNVSDLVNISASGDVHVSGKGDVYLSGNALQMSSGSGFIQLPQGGGVFISGVSADEAYLNDVNIKGKGVFVYPDGAFGVRFLDTGSAIPIDVIKCTSGYLDISSARSIFNVNIGGNPVNIRSSVIGDGDYKLTIGGESEGSAMLSATRSHGTASVSVKDGVALNGYYRDSDALVRGGAVNNGFPIPVVIGTITYPIRNLFHYVSVHEGYGSSSVEGEWTEGGRKVYLHVYLGREFTDAGTIVYPRYRILRTEGDVDAYISRCDFDEGYLDVTICSTEDMRNAWMTFDVIAY